jgi:hypothetical protein
MIRELLRLFVDTFRPMPRARCTCPPHMLAIGAYRRGCPVHPR